MTVLFVVNDAPYGTEKVYNALRMANQLLKDYTDVQVRIFLLADAVTTVIARQQPPMGYYNPERMMSTVLEKGGQVKVCGSCAEARGLKDIPMIEGTELSTMAELARWTVEADKVLTF